MARKPARKFSDKTQSERKAPAAPPPRGTTNRATTIAELMAPLAATSFD